MTALNAGMADSKPDFKPALEQSVGGLAVALLVARVGGGLYIGQLEQTIQRQQSKCEDTKADKTSSEGNTYHITYKNSDKTESEDATINTETETEMFIKKDEDGDITSIVVADFNRGIVAMYIPTKEECYMASGVHSWMSNASASIQDYEKEDSKEIVVDVKNTQNVNFVVASDTPVTDHSVLTSDIRPFCTGNHVYWIHRIDEETQHGPSTAVSTGTRHRIGVCYDYWICCYPVYYDGYWRELCPWIIRYYPC